MSIPCDNCEGTGLLQKVSPVLICEVCKGKGTMPEPENVSSEPQAPEVPVETPEENN